MGQGSLVTQVSSSFSPLRVAYERRVPRLRLDLRFRHSSPTSLGTFSPGQKLAVSPHFCPRPSRLLWTRGAVGGDGRLLWYSWWGAHNGERGQEQKTHSKEIEDVVFGFGTPWVKSYFLPELQFLYL